MSRAFMSEEAEDARAAELPERPISPHPNPVTARGRRLIDEEVARLHDALAAQPDDSADRPHLARDLRYWQARQASARLVEPPPEPPEEVAFNTVVSLRRSDGAETRYRIVGEDEADPTKGLLSWVSPLAEALMGARVGDVVELGGGRPAFTITGISAD
jgi:transcription elongation GreA/GreB family factor